MVTIILRCSHCDSQNFVRNGRAPNGKQRYLCREREGQPEDNSRASKLLRRYGQPALLLSWVPFIGDALVALAGAVNTPFAGFSAWVALGKALRYSAVAWAASAV